MCSGREMSSSPTLLFFLTSQLHFVYITVTVWIRAIIHSSYYPLRVLCLWAGADCMHWLVSVTQRETRLHSPKRKTYLHCLNRFQSPIWCTTCHSPYRKYKSSEQVTNLSHSFSIYLECRGPDASGSREHLIG